MYLSCKKRKIEFSAILLKCYNSADKVRKEMKGMRYFRMARLCVRIKIGVADGGIAMGKL